MSEEQNEGIPPLEPAPVDEETKENLGEPEEQVKFAIHLHSSIKQADLEGIHKMISKCIDNSRAETLRQIEALESTGDVIRDKATLYKEALTIPPDIGEDKQTYEYLARSCTHYSQDLRRLAGGIVHLIQANDERTKLVSRIPIATVIIQNDGKFNLWQLPSIFPGIAEEVLKRWEEVVGDNKECVLNNPLHLDYPVIDIIMSDTPWLFRRMVYDRTKKAPIEDPRTRSLRTTHYKITWPDSCEGVLKAAVEHESNNVRTRKFDTDPTIENHDYGNFLVVVPITIRESIQDEDPTQFRDHLKLLMKNLKTLIDLRMINSGYVYPLELHSAFMGRPDAFEIICQIADDVMPNLRLQLISMGKNGVSVYNNITEFESRVAKAAVRGDHDPLGDY